MDPIIEPLRLGDWLKWEEDNLHSRDAIVVLAGSVLTTGMVLGKITTGGKYVQLDPAASDGSQDAAGILVGDVTAPSGADAPGVAIVREANVNSGALVWPAGITAPQKAAALAELNALHITAREEA